MKEVRLCEYLDTTSRGALRGGVSEKSIALRWQHMYLRWYTRKEVVQRMNGFRTREVAAR